MRFIYGSIANCIAFGITIAMPFSVIARPAIISTEDEYSKVNIRAAASTRSSILQQLSDGTAVEVLNIFRAEDGIYWYYLKDERSRLEGWVHGGFVRFRPSDRSYATLNGDRNDKINVRSGPGQKNSIAHYGLVGDLVLVERDTMGDDGYRWYYVEFPSQAKGWIRQDLLLIWPKGCIITCPNF